MIHCKSLPLLAKRYTFLQNFVYLVGHQKIILVNLVNKMLEERGLEHCADTYVGGALLKGISGGERKRTSVGVELVVRPAMVFLDEPTSGLDSFSAVQLCQVLKKVANAGSSFLCTIHQPTSEIFSSFLFWLSSPTP
jgi:ABC-type multidrug transport system ATPase subunit